MRLLLDTHAIIWHVGQYTALSKTASGAIENPANQLYLSSASLWEMVIKNSLGKLVLHQPVREIINTYQSIGATLLSITPEHALSTERLPWCHRDPFDRILIAQAIHENLTIVSCDSCFADYPVARLW